MRVSEQVAGFRARFRGANDMDHEDAREVSDQERFERCLELHGLALWMDVERVQHELGAPTPEDAVEETNRRRLASSPMPPSLTERRRRRQR